MNPVDQTLYQTLKKLPKIDLHRHLEGSLRFQTLLELAQEALSNSHQWSEETLRSYVQFAEQEPSYAAFLEKFIVLRRFYLSPEIIQRFVQEAIADAAADNIRYLELRFSPQALANLKGFDLTEVTDWVIAATKETSQRYGIKVGLLICLLRHETIELAEKVANIAADRVGKGILGIDLTGNEAEFPGQPFAGIFREAKEAGLRITIHAGEGSGAEAVREAIENLGAERIGHGVRVLEDESIAKLVVEKQTPLELCITSNLQTGVIPNIEIHPLPQLLEDGLNVTLNSDDPGVSDMALTDDYYLAAHQLGLSIKTLSKMVLKSANAAFLPAAEKQELLALLQQDLPISVPTLSGQI